MSMDSTAAAASASAVAATAAVQALSEGLHSSTFPQHTFTLLSSWTEDPVSWFMYPEAEFALARVPAKSNVCDAASLHRIVVPPPFHPGNNVARLFRSRQPARLLLLSHNFG
jgi:hypothetical protein